MEIAKALILAADTTDARPWPAAAAGPSHLFPIANRPILFHNLEALRAAGVLEAAIVAEPHARHALECAVDDGGAWGLSVRYIDWPATRGLGQVLEAGDDFIAGEPLLVQHGDALLRERMHGHIAAFAREQLDTLAFQLDTATAGQAAAQEPGYLLSRLAVSILRDDPDATASPIVGVRARGGRVRVQRVAGWLPCHGDRDTLLESNRHLLERIELSVDPVSLQDTRVQGPVVIHPTARVRRSLLRGPAIIGPHATISDAYVGPYTSIGPRVSIEGAEIEHSIVLAGADLRFVGARLESSIIGEGARVARGFDVPAAIRLSVGDAAEVILR
jgi:glucose-1-phosphate thymidylyltransferase